MNVDQTSKTATDAGRKKEGTKIAKDAGRYEDGGTVSYDASDNEFAGEEEGEETQTTHNNHTPGYHQGNESPRRSDEGESPSRVSASQGTRTTTRTTTDV